MEDLQQKIFALLEKHYDSWVDTLEIAKGVGKKTQKDVNPTLYDMMKKDLIRYRDHPVKKSRKDWQLLKPSPSQSPSCTSVSLSTNPADSSILFSDYPASAPATVSQNALNGSLLPFDIHTIRPIIINVNGDNNTVNVNASPGGRSAIGSSQETDGASIDYTIQVARSLEPPANVDTTVKELESSHRQRETNVECIYSRTGSGVQVTDDDDCCESTEPKYVC